MTALDRYVRLEALGDWRERPDAMPREVVVALGKSTLLLKDLDERPLGHWAIAGVVRLRRQGPAVTYSMTVDGAETLTIRDPAMTEAIAAVARPGLAPRGRRLRLPVVPLVGLALAAALGVAAARVLPSEAARLVPPVRAAALGERMLADLAEGGCARPEGDATVDILVRRLAPANPPEVRLLPLATSAALLPGGTLVVDAAFATSAPPEEIARAVGAALAGDPLAEAFAAAGPVTELRYILTGHLDEAALVRTAAALAGPCRE